MSGIFSKIIAGEIPSYKIAEDENYFAFLDINPLSKGHALVVPKKEIDYIFDLDEECYNGLFSFARKVSKAIENTVDCIRIGMVIYGLDVAHAHIHLIPLTGNNDIDFNKKRVKLTEIEFAELAKTIGHEFLEIK
ncbi:MAG: HIT family protein [Bacteroidales bacterium]|nr:HIT family protein [Bacteroidales bacterium]